MVVTVVFAGVEDGGTPTEVGVGRRCWGCADDDVVVGMATSVDGVGRLWCVGWGTGSASGPPKTWGTTGRGGGGGKTSCDDVICAGA